MTTNGSACCHHQGKEDHAHDNEFSERRQLLLQGLLSLICLLAILIAWSGHRFISNFPLNLQLGLYILAYLTGGFFPLKGVIDDLKSWTFNVNFLMVAAAIGAAVIGEFAEGAVLMFLFCASGALEGYAGGRSRRAIQALMKLSPSEATILKDGVEKVIPAATLKLGDIFIVLPGERFPGDGIITFGNTSVDQSSITGESIPIDRNPGDRVMAGTINRHGVVNVQMDRDLKDTTLSKIFKIIEESQQQKAPTERLVEKYGGPYTKVIVLATLGTFLGSLWFTQGSWHDCLYRAMTLMVVASPCALVLSIPSAVLAAIANGAWHGILFKGGLAVETIGRAKVFAFDKTGTLTQGKPRLKEARYAEGGNPDDILARVASLEMNSEHPLAEVLVREAREKNLKFERATESKAVPGMGMEGVVLGGKIRIGSEAFVCLYGGMEPWVREALVDFRSRGLTCLVAASDKPLAVFGMADLLRPGSPKAIRELKAMGIQTVMLTGDNASSAGEFARQLGISDFRAGLLPHQKVQVLKELMEQNPFVAMVGDGVNDAPALVTASVGIAMGGTGSDAALENADVVLMSDEIERIPEVIRLGQKAERIIFQNLTFAILVIAALMILTFLDRLTLAVGVVGHEGSTILVVFNSLRLLYSKA